MTLPAQQALEGKIEEQRIVLAQDVEIMNGCLGQQPGAGQRRRRSQRHDAGQRVVGTMQQARVQVAAFEQGADDRRLAVALADRRDVAMQQLSGARLGHQFEEEIETAADLAVVVDIIAERGAVRDHHLDPGVERPTQAQRIAQGLRIAALDRLFLAAMHNQRRTAAGEHAVEGIAARVGRIHAHRRWQPFDGAGAAGNRRFQTVDRIGAIRMQGSDPFETRREILRQLCRPGIRHVESRMLRMRVAASVVKTLEGKEHDLEAGRHRIAQVEQAGDVGLIDLARRIVGAAGIHVEQALRVIERMQRRSQLRPDLDAAAAIAQPGQMYVAIPELRRIDAVPDLAEPGAVIECRRNGDAAFVDQHRLGAAPAGRRQGGRAAEQA